MSQTESDVMVGNGFERHFKAAEIAAAWNVHANTVRRLFRNEPGVLMIGEDRARLVKRKYVQRHVVLRIPESVVLRVQSRLQRNYDPATVPHRANRLRSA